MSENYDQYLESLLARARDGFLRLDELLDTETLRASSAAKEDLEKLLSAAAELEHPEVLVVDDDSAVRNVVCRQLERREFRCHSVDSAEQGWEYMETHVPHVVITDVIMPGTSGLEFLSQVMYRFPDMVIVLISAAPDVSMTIEALRAGATDFIVKPIDFNSLVDAVHRGLERRRARLNQLRYQFNLELIVSERSRRLIENSGMLEQRTRELGLAYRDVVVRLGRAAQWRDDETGAHIQRIGIFSAEIARRMGLPRDQVELLAEAAPLHDIGKIGVPDSILLKPGRLTPPEFEIMKSHTLIGAAILSGADAPLLRASERIALQHHEWFNGGGYPRGTAGQDIDIYGRIVAVADVYDALIHSRIYKKALSFDETVTTIKARRGTQFCPDALDAFLDVVDEFPRLEKALDRATQPLAPAEYDLHMGLVRLPETATPIPSGR